MLFVLLFLLCSFVLNRKNNNWATSPLFYGIVVIKSIYAIVYISVYSVFYHGEGDMFYFVSNTQELISYIGLDPWKYYQFLKGDFVVLNLPSELYDYVVLEPRVTVFLKVFYVFFIASFANMYVAIWAIVLFSSWIIYRVYISDVIKNKQAFVIAFLLLPSYSFWTSGISKEAFILPLLLWLFVALAEVNSLKTFLLKLTWTLPMLVWIFKVKYYYGFLFLLFTIYYISLTQFKIPKRYLLFVSIAIGSILLSVAPYLHPYLSLKLLPELIQVNYQMFCPDPNYVTCVQFSMDGTWKSIFYSLPMATLYGMFGPWIGQAHHFWAGVLSIEHTLIFFSTLYVLYLSVRGKVSIRSADVVLCVGILMTAALICMAAPNLGSLSRYKEIYWPLWVYTMVKYILPQMVHWLPKRFQ